MTIEKGTPWGRPGSLPENGVVVRSDAEASRVLDTARREKKPDPVLGLLGGDLARTCGAIGDVARLRGPDAQTLPVDRGEVLVDGILRCFVAHVIVRRRSARGGWWLGPVTAVMNAQFVGHWDVAPRSHPNDGRLDVVEGDPGLDDRLKMRRRLRTGTHVPHPAITIRRLRSVQLDVPPGARVWLDGVLLPPARSLSIRVVPDALHVVV